MTKRIFAVSFLLLSSIALVSFAQDRPFRFGIEMDGKLKKIDPSTIYDSPTGNAYIGVFAEYHVTNHFSGKFGIGLNNTYIHQGELVDFPLLGGGTGTIPAITKIKQTLGLSLEPRFYLFSTERSQGVNLFFALPVAFESAPSSTQYTSMLMIRPELKILPSLGFRYDFNKHWAVEASGGLGWIKYFKRGRGEQLPSSQMGYTLSTGIRYTF
jgi:hypothetical protein